MQGSGILANGNILRYTGKQTENPPGCPTTTGADGTCLFPYISIAADLSRYRAGDIISMPSLRGQVVRLANGVEVEHPGYFIVADTGGAIKGKGRFDMFTGIMNQHDRVNSFGSGAGGLEVPKITDKKSCEGKEYFHLTPEIMKDGVSVINQEYVDAKKALDAFRESIVGSVGSSINHDKSEFVIESTRPAERPWMTDTTRPAQRPRLNDATRPPTKPLQEPKVEGVRPPVKVIRPPRRSGGSQQ